MMHLMIAGMIAVNVYKIDNTNMPENIRDKGYIPAPMVSPRAGDTLPIEYIPYTPVIMCTVLNGDYKEGSTSFTCGEHNRIWLKI
jgi:hypothetical protein